MKWFGRFIHITAAIAGLTTAIFLAVVLTSSTVAFTQAFDNIMGAGSYQNFIDAAKQAGWDGTASFLDGTSMYDTIVWAMMVVGAGLIWGWVSVTIFGEIKGVTNVRATFLSMLLPIIGGVTASIYLLAQYNVMGTEFSSAVYYLGYNGDPLVNTLPLPWYLMSIWLPIITLGANAAPLIILLSILLAITPFYNNAANILMPVRYIFAMAFDGAYPRKMAYMDIKRHVPTLGNAIIMIGGLIWMVATVLSPGILSYVAAVIAAQMALYVFATIAAIVFPYRMKDVYKASPIGKFNIAGIPLVTILGIAGAIAIGYTTYFFLATPLLGGTANVPTMVVIWVGSFIGYYVMKWYRSSKEGIDLNLAFKQIPPE